MRQKVEPHDLSVNLKQVKVKLHIRDNWLATY